MTIPDAIARLGGRQGGPGRVALALCLASVVATRPAAEQPPAPPQAWAEAVDLYLAGEHAAVAASLRNVPASELRIQARTALDVWLARARAAEGGPHAAAERRLAIRRMQAAALLPLEIVLPMSARLRAPSVMEPYEDISIGAWERLAVAEELRLEPPGAAGRKERDEERARLHGFRTWWRVAVLQYLVNVGRHRDFLRQARLIRPTSGDHVMRAELHVMHGMVKEQRARASALAERESGADTRLPTSRLRGVTQAHADAAREYGRALESVPTHAEARLRLGRVLLERKRPDEAIATLAPLMARACTTTTCALAALFTGEAHDALGQWDRAADAYATASSRQDVRQSALVALLQLAARRGNVSAATGLVGHFGSAAPLGRLESRDAWGIYVTGQRQNVDAVLSPLREARLP